MLMTLSVAMTSSERRRRFAPATTIAPGSPAAVFGQDLRAR
jgi:hypothetical protein